MVEKNLSALSAAELRKLAAEKDWGEYCAARMARQSNRIQSITHKIAMRTNALEEAKKLLVEAKADMENGPPPGWKLPTGREGGYSIEVPTGNIETRGN